MLVFLCGCGASQPNASRAVPPHRIVQQQGDVRLTVVAPEVAADDAGLLRIAESLLPAMTRRLVMLQVWTDAAMVPDRIESMTDAQLAARKAVVTINRNTGFRKVERF
jgi:hypothetical protein